MSVSDMVESSVMNTQYISQPTDSKKEKIEEIVQKSWIRCETSYQLDPSQKWKAEVLCGAEFRHVSSRSALLLRQAAEEMQHLFTLVQGLGLMVLLADADAMILARCVDATHLSVCRRLNLREGAIWNEAIAGTNGIGTCVEDKCPIFLGHGAHWRFCFTLLISYAVPLFDAQGRVAGALNLASMNGKREQPVDKLLMETLAQSGRRIEEQLFRNSYAGQKILTLGSVRGCSAPLVSVNNQGEIIGATHAAREWMGWTDQTIAEHPNLLTELEEGSEISFQKAEENVIRSALAVSQGNVTQAARGLGISRATLYRKMKGFGMS
ncbi:Fis family transcriptional regulator [Acetobacter pomorum DSM 11825]|nr:helix-turn-helix domain-containing protein [Acetobacter pomorum]GBR50213.1 Fis family transcriptional regulator [Acetobacter pomorum DSM 11825]